MKILAILFCEKYHRIPSHFILYVRDFAVFLYRSGVERNASGESWRKVYKELHAF